ncbi:MAG: VCBS repeat-containing protein, partial [Candidatus Sumerlaeota bacterium]|nr:VCBS repeat-containing protein [Candidatus Sumerlaeota bacterium]
NGVYWYKIPSDPKQPWEKHSIGPGVHGAIAPAGVADINGDGRLDVVRADTWFENKDGKGLEWIAHPNIPMGRTGPYGVCVRTVITDMDGDGKAEIVMADTDIVQSKVAVLKNADGKGGSWIKTEMPQSFAYGSLHSLAVADFNGDGRPDIVVNEQEELLPPGRENPRWILWENLGNLKFAEHIILDTKLGGHELQVGDVDGDGDMDICSKPWGVLPWNGANGKMHVDFLENLQKR